MIERPGIDEYEQYYGNYISCVPDGDLIKQYKIARDNLLDLFEKLDEEKWAYRYAPEKWTLKELFLHISDTERVFQYRLLRIARNDSTSLAGFDQDIFIEANDFDHLTREWLLNDYRAVSASTLSLLESLTEKDSIKWGYFNGNACSARAVAYIIPGHILHHLEVINEYYLK